MNFSTIISISVFGIIFPLICAIVGFPILNGIENPFMYTIMCFILGLFYVLGQFLGPIFIIATLEK